jgi:hypothetical protein
MNLLLNKPVYGSVASFFPRALPVERIFAELFRAKT